MRTGQQRDIVFLDLQLEAIPNYAPTWPISALLEKADAYIRMQGSAGEVVGNDSVPPAVNPSSVWWSRDKSRKIFARHIDVSSDPDYATLLIYSTDKNGPGASFADLQTDQQRDENKQASEGRPESCHVVIQIAPTSARTHRHLMLLEEAPTLGRARVQAFLNFLLKRVCYFNARDFKHPNPDGAVDRNGKQKLYSYYNTVDLKGHLSDAFEADILAGKLSGIALETTHERQMGVGESPFVRASRKTNTLKTKLSWQEHAMASIRDALRLGSSNNYEAVRVAFVSADKVSHTVLLDSESGSVINDGYLKRQRIETSSTIWKEATEDIDPTIIVQMKHLIETQ